MKKYPLLYGLVGIVFVSIVAYFIYHTRSHVSAKVSVNVHPQAIHNEEVELIVSTFLHQLVEGHIKEAQGFTTGDTFKVLNSNRSQKVGGTLLDDKIHIQSLTSDFAQVDVDASVETKAGKDRNHYLYSLMKVGGNWKIFRIDEIPVIFQSSQEGTLPENAGMVIDQYLGDVSNAQWKESLAYLSGQAFQELEKSFTFLPKNLKTQINVKSKKALNIDQDKALVLVSYTLSNDIQKDKPIQTLFQLQMIGGDWKISQITNVVGGENDINDSF